MIATKKAPGIARMPFTATAGSPLKAMRGNLKDQQSKGLVLQAYCNSVLQQPVVDFSMDANLKGLQDQINTGLKAAQTHAQTYLQSIQPSILSAMSALENYLTLYATVPTTLPAGSSVQQWVAALQAVKQVSESNLRNSKMVLASLNTLVFNLQTDSAAFAQVVSSLNQTLKGDNGELSKIQGQLSALDSQIAGTIVATVFGGLGILGGVVMVLIGAIADFVTAGTSSELVIGGVALIVTGVGTEVGTIISLVSLYNQKAALLTEQAQLTEEVKLVTGISGAYTQLKDQAAASVEAAQTMQSTWQTLTDDLQSLIDDLQSGILSTDDARKAFLQEANTDILNIQTDIRTIKNQIAGIATVKAAATTSLQAHLNELAKTA